MSKERHTSTKTTRSHTGEFLSQEEKTITIDSENNTDTKTEVIQRLCENCGSKIVDSNFVRARCAVCNAPMCINCGGSKTSCCGVSLCPLHRHSCTLDSKPILLCPEHKDFYLSIEARRIHQIELDNELKRELAKSSEARNWAQTQSGIQKTAQELRLSHNEQVLKAYQINAQIAFQRAQMQLSLTQSIISMGQQALSRLGNSSIPALRPTKEE